jgi:uncharacterized protein YbjT (DUF2867 family)
MNTKDKIILVTGGTGRQGGAVARHLLQDGWQVRAITRDSNKPSAGELTSLGVEVFEGDLNTITSKHPAFKGLYGIYSVQTFWEDGLEGEIRQGKRLADIAAELRIKHFVYSSVGAAERNTGLPHFDSKWQIEEHIRGLNLPATIIRPVFFMDNFNSEQYRLEIPDGSLRLPMDPGKPLQMIAVDDIGGFVALVFSHPDEYTGKAIELAGDELTIPQVADIFSSVLGQKVLFVRMPIEEIRRVSSDLALMFEWFNRYGYQADIPALRRVYPQLMTVEKWLQKSDWTKYLHEAEVTAR